MKKAFRTNLFDAGAPRAKHVAFIVPANRPLTQEELQAWNFLSKTKGIKARKIAFSQLATNPSLMASYDVIWWHCDETYPEPEQFTPPLVEAFRTHLARGRGLLLSLLACQFVADLGFEAVRPNTVVHGQWAETAMADGYPDIRGFAGFNRHPIFNGFFGGLYTCAPSVGEPYSACYYQDALPSSGRVVAVEKLYIKLDERRRTIVEYNLGTGRILTIGSHFYLHDKTQRFRAHLEKFAGNCLTYLGEMRERPLNRKANEKQYWNFGTSTVASFQHSSKALGRFATSLPIISSGLEIHRDLSTSTDEEQFYDVTGRRLLIMGKERGGIDEICSHPARLFKNIRIAFKVGDSDWHWANELRPSITIRPESLTRRYECDGAVMEEVIYAALRSPAGILHYEVESNQPVQIVVAAQTDLRMMWPLNEQATGSLRYAWDPGLRSTLVTDSSRKNAAVFGASCPRMEQLVGQFSEIMIDNDHLVGIPTDEILVSSALRITLSTKTRRCTFVFAGSGLSMNEALRSYRSTMKNIPGLLSEQAQHYKRLLRTSVQFVTPDAEFNQSYRWSVVGTDKFFAETPGLGSSFLAGYGLSSSGWNGGHKVSGRPGYAWYFGRDSAWTCMAALDYGDFEKVHAVLEFLGRHQDVDGKILHELSTSGHAHYDAADSTPLYLVVFGRYLRASGDVGFARMELPKIKKALTYCHSTDTDGDHLIENTNVGHGWIEGGRLFPAHTEHYLASCWAQALTEAAYISEALNEAHLASKCKREANIVKTIVRNAFRNEETGFYSFAKNRDGTYRSERTVLPTVGMYLDCADREFSQRSLTEYASDKFSADWGVRIVGKDDPLFEPTGYHYGSIWPLFTGWTSLAEFRMKRPVQGFSHLLTNAMLYDQFSAGAFEEVLHGVRFQPAGVCPHQAWSGTMILQPALEGMLGLRTDARTHSLEMKPYLPPHWQVLEAKRIRVGSQRVRMKIHRGTDETVFFFSVRSLPKSKRSHTVHLSLQPVFPLGTHIHEMWIDGTLKGSGRIVDKYDSSPTIRAAIKSQLEVRFKHFRGVSVVPPRPHFIRGAESTGLRILAESWKDDTYLLTVEGMAGEEYLVDVFDPSSTVKHVEGAILLARDGEYLTMSVVFSENASTGYTRKEVTLAT